jgi:hypothetical protein
VTCGWGTCTCCGAPAYTVLLATGPVAPAGIGGLGITLGLGTMTGAVLRMGARVRGVGGGYVPVPGVAALTVTVTGAGCSVVIGGGCTTVVGQPACLWSGHWGSPRGCLMVLFRRP